MASLLFRKGVQIPLKKNTAAGSRSDHFRPNFRRISTPTWDGNRGASILRKGGTESKLQRIGMRNLGDELRGKPN